MKRAIWRALRTRDSDLFWHRSNWEQFERLLERCLAALDDRADPRIIKGLRDMYTWGRRNTELVDLVLNPFRNLPRLNSLLKLMLLDLRGEADETQWVRILRANHLAHHGQPPPRRLVDDKVIKLP